VRCATIKVNEIGTPGKQWRAPAQVSWKKMLLVTEKPVEQLAEQGKGMSAQLEEQSNVVSTIMAMVEKLSQPVHTAARRTEE